MNLEIFYFKISVGSFHQLAIKLEPFVTNILLHSNIDVSMHVVFVALLGSVDTDSLAPHETPTSPLKDHRIAPQGTDHHFWEGGEGGELYRILFSTLGTA